MFLKFKDLLTLTARRDTKGYGSYVEAAMDRPMDEIVPLRKTYLKNIHENRRRHLALPPSTLLEDEPSFRRFAERHRLLISP